MNFPTPFQLDSISLSAWADTAIPNTCQAVDHSHTIIKAFNKTIAPVITTTAIDLGQYYWLCFQGAEQWTMDRQPISSGVRAVYTGLTSSASIATYCRVRYLVDETAMVLLGFCLGFALPFLAAVNSALGGYRVAERFFRAVYGRLNPSPSASDLLMPSVGIAIASHQEFASQPGSAAAQAAAVEDVPDFWAEPLPLFHTPPVVGVAWNPAPGRNMHEEVRRLFELQHVPLTLPAPIIEQLAPEPATELPEQAPVVDELATALDVPGAIAKPKRERKPKARLSKAAAAKPKEARASAGAKGEK
jgi:hypothetical protein